MEYLNSKKPCFDGQDQMCLCTALRQPDPKGTGLALWRPVSFPATTTVLNDLERSISTLLPLKISSVLVAWQPLQCDLPLATHVYGI